MGQTITVPFHGTTLLAITTDAGPPLVPLPPLVEGMNIDWPSQLKRIKRDPILSKSMVMMTMLSGQAAQCLPLRRIPGFLFKVDTRRIKDAAIKAKVLDFQDGAYDALADACLGPEVRPATGQTPAARPITALAPGEARILVAECRKTFGALQARELWFALDLPRVPSMARLPSLDLFAHAANRGEQA